MAERSLPPAPPPSPCLEAQVPALATAERRGPEWSASTLWTTPLFRSLPWRPALEVLSEPLLEEEEVTPTVRAGPHCLRRSYERAAAIVSYLRESFLATTDDAFIRSEINGRRSRRIVLFAFLCADAVGGFLWAFWCESGRTQTHLEGEQAQACMSFGINHYLLWSISVPAEGLVLFLAGRNPWSFWSDAWLLPVWLVRLGFFDVLLWNVPPQTLVGDALWFSVIAVMCRVHSLVLWILVTSEVASLFLVLAYQGALQDMLAFDHVRYGIYSVVMLTIMAGAYFLDEQSRLQSYGKVMSLQDQNAALAEMMMRWKVLPGSEKQHTLEHASEEQLETGQLERVASDETSSLNSPCSFGSLNSFKQQLQQEESARRLHLMGIRPAAAPPKLFQGTGSNGSKPSSGPRVRFTLPRAPLGSAGSTVPTSQPQGASACSNLAAADLMDIME